jgi:hypothetical protein
VVPLILPDLPWEALVEEIYILQLEKYFKWK